MINYLKAKFPTIYKHGDDIRVLDRDRKVRKLEQTFQQRALQALLWVTFGGTAVWLFVLVLTARATPLLNWLLVPYTLVLMVVSAEVMILATFLQSKIQRWLLGATLILGYGLVHGNWRLVLLSLAVTAGAQTARPAYTKLEDALTLWEPDDKNSVYHDFSVARRAAELL